MAPHTRTREIVLAAADVQQRVERQAVEEHPGVRRTVLWEDGTSAAGVLSLDAGASIGEHTHPEHEHHVWVEAGRASVRGEVLDAGSYWYVSAGADHTLQALSPSGCRLFYLYLHTTRVHADG